MCTESLDCVTHSTRCDLRARWTLLGASLGRYKEDRIELGRRRLGGKVKRERFVKLVMDVLDSLPFEFRDRIHNLAVLVEDQPSVPKRPQGAAKRAGRRMPQRLILGIFEGVPATRKSAFDLCSGPNRIILYQRNIEAICSNKAEIRHEVRQTVLHELGHYFGMNESQLKDV